MSTSAKDTKLPKKLFPFLMYFIRKFWGLAFLYQFLCLIWAVENTAWPYVLGKIVDLLTSYTGKSEDIWQFILVPMIMAGILYVGIGIVYRLAEYVAAKLYPRLESEIRMKMFDYVQFHSHSYYLNMLGGSVANKISDMPPSVYALLDFIFSILVPVFLAAIISVIMFFNLNPLFGGLLFFWIISHIGICAITAKKSANNSVDHSEARSVLQGRIVDNITNSGNVRTFARQDYEMAYIRKFQDDEKNKYTIALKYNLKVRTILTIVNILFVAIGLGWFTIYSFQHGLISIGEVILIFNTTFNINMMVWLVGIELQYCLRQIGICQQAISVISKEHDIVDDKDAKDLVVNKGEIVFDNVTFNYSRNNNIFHDKSITIEAGTKVGLVGFSGSGKTTFVNLILRYFDISGGHIYIDGQDIAKVTQKSLRRQISIIPQEPILFHRTVKDNIRYGKIDASDEEVMQAAKIAHCHKFIMSLHDKYNYIIGERGLKMSGGQRQRLAIARAVLKQAPIIILDEATASLDTISEGYIQEAMDELMQGKTAIIIAHRLSTLSSCDRILVFDKGSIIEDGTHDELLALGGHYAKMWEKQIGGFLPELN